MDRELLTEEDKKFIIENYSKMGVFQMGIRLGIKLEGRKCPIIEEFVNSAGLSEAKIKEAPKTVSIAEEPKSSFEKVEEIVRPPEPVVVDDTPETVTLEEFSKYVHDLGFPVRSPLSEKEKRDLNFLKAQMESTRFSLFYKSFRKTDFKKLFKEEFVKALYGKGDMPTEEVNDFMDLANEMVLQYDIKLKIKDTEKIKEDKNTTNAQKVAIETLINELQDKYGDSIKRAGQIKQHLGAHREQRMKDNRAIGLTVAALLEAVYDIEKRESLVKLQQQKDKELGKVITDLDSLDETKALIMGISPEDLMSGAL